MLEQTKSTVFDILSSLLPTGEAIAARDVLECGLPPSVAAWMRREVERRLTGDIALSLGLRQSLPASEEGLRMTRSVVATLAPYAVDTEDAWTTMLRDAIAGLTEYLVRPRQAVEAILFAEDFRLTPARLRATIEHLEPYSYLPATLIRMTAGNDTVTRDAVRGLIVRIDDAVFTMHGRDEVARLLAPLADWCSTGQGGTPAIPLEAAMLFFDDKGLRPFSDAIAATARVHTRVAFTPDELAGMLEEFRAGANLRSTAPQRQAVESVPAEPPPPTAWEPPPPPEPAQVASPVVIPPSPVIPEEPLAAPIAEEEPAPLHEPPVEEPILPDPVIIDEPTPTAEGMPASDEPEDFPPVPMADIEPETPAIPTVDPFVVLPPTEGTEEPDLPPLSAHEDFVLPPLPEIEGLDEESELPPLPPIEMLAPKADTEPPLDHEGAPAPHADTETPMGPVTAPALEASTERETEPPPEPTTPEVDYREMLRRNLALSFTSAGIQKSITPPLSLSAQFSDEMRNRIVAQLFHGDAAQFDRMVAVLEALPSWREAARQLTDFLELNRLNPYAAGVMEFTDIVRRWFLHDEEEPMA